MILLPSSPATNDAELEPIDFGIDQRPGTGGPGTHIDRPGARYRARFSFPPMMPDDAGVFEVRLGRARSEGIRHRVPLLGVDQSAAGSPVVNGDGAGGTSVPVRNLDGLAREGWRLNVVTASGVHCLHQLAADAYPAGGLATLSVWPPLRVDLIDGCLVIFDNPKIEGMVTEIGKIPLPVTRRVSLGFTVEEQL